MSGQIMWGKFMVVTGIIMVSGWGVMKLATPSEEQFYQALSPDLKQKVDQIRAQRAGGSAIRDQLAAAGEQDQVVWAEQLGATKGPAGGRRV